MERTTDRVESLNQKIKIVVTKYSNLNTFFKDLMVSISSSACEKNEKVIRQEMKRPRT